MQECMCAQAWLFRVGGTLASISGTKTENKTKIKATENTKCWQSAEEIGILIHCGW